MRFSKLIFAAFTLIFVCNFTNIYAQQTSPKQIKILNNYGHIPFEDGKTTIAEVKFVGFDSDYEQYDNKMLGNKIPESDFLKYLKDSKTDINANDKFSGAKVAKAVKVIKEKILRYGYLNAEVVAYGEELPKNRMNLIFSVKRGNPAFVSEIRFDGNINVSSEELSAEIKKCLIDNNIFDERYFDYCAEKDLRTLFFSKGFFKIKIHSITPRRVANSYVVEISIDEGLRYVYGTVKFEGAKVFSEKELTEILKWKTGKVANGKHLQDSLYEKLRKDYADKGYINYSADFDLTYIEPQAKGLDGIVNIIVNIDEELQYKVGKLEFVGIDEDEARKLKELIPLNVGEVYNQSKFEEGIKKINELKEFYPIDYQTDVEMLVPRYREGMVMGGLIIGETPRLKYKDENISKEIPGLDLIISTRKLTEDERKNYK